MKKHGTITAAKFKVLIDTAEQYPFEFKNLRADADRGNRLISVDVVYRCLGRHPHSLGDYSIESLQGESYVGQVAVERKSLDDAHATILGFNDGHRERFECELHNLADVAAPLVVVECSFADLIQCAPQWGTRTAATNAKTIMRSVMAWQRRFRIPWLFCGSRRLAEIATFRHLEGFYRDIERRDDSKPPGKTEPAGLLFDL